MKKKRFPWSRLVLPLVAVLALGAYGYTFGGWFEKETSSELTGAPVRKGPLRIEVLQRGNLKAKNSVQLRSGIEGRSTILYLIPEGTEVSEGELVAELDASSLEDRIVTQEIAVANAQASFTKAEQNLEIQKSANRSDIAKGDQNLEFAISDLKKFLEGDSPQSVQKAKEDILLAEERLAQAEDTLNWSKRLSEKGFLTRTKLNQDELTYESNKIQLEQAQRAESLLKAFELPKQEATLRAAVEEAKRELERVKLQAAARLVDNEAEVRTSTAKLRLEEEKLRKIQDQIAAAKIRAPVDGMVVYAREESRWGQGDPIQEGTEVRERQDIITIPRAGGMIVEAKLHESVLKKVEPGQPAIVQIDAMPGREFRGRVSFVAHLPDQGSWWANPNQRLYRTEIAIEEGDPEMRPGMSCAVQIIVAELEQVNYVPVQAVIYHRGRTICFVDQNGSLEERVVQVGQSSDKWVEIVEGLKENEMVLLSPPPGFMPEDEKTEDETAPRPPGPPGSGKDPNASFQSGYPRGGNNGSMKNGSGGGRPGQERGAQPGSGKEFRQSGNRPGGNRQRPKESQGGSQ
ncbi:MAG: efflux RND transporter periplasmic adaptor subunit [Planctomycetota bacterium]|nr:MAG: efflux RND transporter periplasmic adaptor subunit [Planctomycetota bacterium]